VIVVGAGAAGGLVTAHLQAQWAAQEALEVAAATPLDHSNDVTVPHPVVITVIEERRITPEPVIVHRKVYRTVGAPTGSQPRRQSPPAPGVRTSNPKPGRAVVAPAPKAPRATSAPAVPATTSKAS
jgi:hypothetical protein